MNAGKRVSGVAKAVQHFKPLPEEAMDALIRQGDVLWCAGGFAIGTANLTRHSSHVLQHVGIDTNKH